MYYYIFESTPGSKRKRLQRKIKDLIAQTGIAGETVSPSPARTIDELTQIGGSKGYSTVVAVGSDLFLNRVASSLLNNHKYDDKKIVLGVIPWDIKQSFFAVIAGLKSLPHAIETLKFRKLSPLPLGLVEPNKYFVSPISITIPKKTMLRIQTPDFETQIHVTQASITKDLNLQCEDATYQGPFVKQMWNWLLGKEKPNLSQSIFRHRQFTIGSPQPLPVVLEQETIAKTPIAVRPSPKTLHLIVGRDKLGA